jgi:hypothetical protein
MHHKAFLSLLLVIFHNELSQQASKKKADPNVMKFTQFQCDFHDDWFYPNSTCFMKVWKRRVPTLNSHFLVKRVLSKILVNFCDFSINFLRISENLIFLITFEIQKKINFTHQGQRIFPLQIRHRQLPSSDRDTLDRLLSSHAHDHIEQFGQTTARCRQQNGAGPAA